MMGAGMRGGCRVAAAVVGGSAVALFTSGLLAVAAVHDAVGVAPPPAQAQAAGSPPCSGQDPSRELSCQVGTVLTRVPGGSAVGGVTPAPPVTQPPTPSRAAAAPGTAVRAAPAIDPSPAPAPALTPAEMDASAEFGNEPFLQSLLAILAHPVDGRPQLRHFRVSASGASLPVGLAGAIRARPSGAPAADGAVLALRALLATVLGGTVVLVALAVAGLRRTGDGAPSTPGAAARPLRRLALALALAGAAAGAGAAVWEVAPVAALVRSVTPAPPGPTLSSTRVAPGADGSHAGGAVSGTPLWQQLTAIEARLADDRDRLTLLDGEMRRVLGTGAEPVGLDSAMLRPSRIARLVASRDAAAADDRAAQESEYALYRTAADDPAARTGLLDGALAMPDASAVAAVGDNLQLVDTQVTQEKAIARAQEMLASYTRFSAGQLDGIARNQRFIVPEIAPLTQAFGPTDFWMEPPLTYRGTFHPHFHTGIDLAAPLRTPLHAAADGVVLLATSSVDARGRLVGYGNYVLIGHGGGVATLYGHLDSIIVKAGDVVRQGQVIGLEGSTGWSTGPHVHFEIRRSQEVLDPAELLTGTITWPPPAH
jgi:murein DD-endopeptidase MepM/ murein hydrolase activator NlpD